MWRASDTMMPPFTNTSAVARFNLSAKTVNLSALPSPSVSSQILMSVMARLAFGNEAVGIITRLDHPGASALVPRHVDGLHDVRFGGEELQIEIRRHLRVAHAVLRRERRLIFHRLGAALIIRHLARQTLQRRTRGEQSFPGGLGLLADALEHGFAQNRIRRPLAIGVFDQPVARALETVEQLLLGRADLGVRHHLHHRVKVLQIGVGEIGEHRRDDQSRSPRAPESGRADKRSSCATRHRRSHRLADQHSRC